MVRRPPRYGYLEVDPPYNPEEPLTPDNDEHFDPFGPSTG